MSVVTMENKNIIYSAKMFLNSALYRLLKKMNKYRDFVNINRHFMIFKKKMYIM